MKIDVVAKVDEIQQEDTVNKTVIVIDILRATSTIVTALARGAKSVIPVETIGQARQYRGDQYLLAGERFGKKITGFPYSNSPTEMLTAPLAGHQLVLTTTNGTRAIQKSLRASHILIGSLLNGSACASLAGTLRKDITILCAGTRHKFALEDGIAAGFLTNAIIEFFSDVSVNDLGLAMAATYAHVQSNLKQIARKTATGKRLLGTNWEEDIAFCAQLNKYNFVPVMKDGCIAPSTPGPIEE